MISPVLGTYREAGCFCCALLTMASQNMLNVLHAIFWITEFLHAQIYFKVTNFTYIINLLQLCLLFFYFLNQIPGRFVSKITTAIIILIVTLAATIVFRWNVRLGLEKKICTCFMRSV